MNLQSPLPIAAGPKTSPPPTIPAATRCCLIPLTMYSALEGCVEGADGERLVDAAAAREPSEPIASTVEPVDGGGIVVSIARPACNSRRTSFNSIATSLID